MDSTSLGPVANDFSVVLIGAGNVMFGSNEGPWNHSLRLEQKLGSRLNVLAIIDPDLKRAIATLAKKRDSSVEPAYRYTRVYAAFDEFVKAMSPTDRPRAAIVGTPAMIRGTTEPGRDIEMQVLKHLPGAALFLEKPIATGPVSEIKELFEVAKRLSDNNVVCAVGYMLRYLKAVQKMKQIVQDNKLTVMCTIARYACAYESIAKPNWWNKSKDGGPIIEQATHFCDLSRYFGGEVDLPTISAHTLEWHENAGHLTKVPIDECKIAPEDKIPRVTAATWKYASGAVGSLVHLVALQGTNYSAEFEVFADGYSFKLLNPYVQPILQVRKPGDDVEHIINFEGDQVDDPFFSEISRFVDVIEQGPEGGPLLSPYEDACRTYEFTWAIREVSERARKR